MAQPPPEGACRALVWALHCGVPQRSGGDASGLSEGVRMGICIDKSTRFLRSLGYNVVRHPSGGIAPLDVVGWKGGSPVRLGDIDGLLATHEGTPPPLETDIPSGAIEGKKTSKLPIKLGLDIFGAVIGALGGNAGVTASYEGARRIEFSYHDPTRDRTDPLSLGRYLQANDVAWDNPVLDEYLLGRGRLLVVIEVVKAKKFGVTAYSESKTEVAVEIEVGHEGASETAVTYAGATPLVFGFKCAELAAVDDSTGELRLTWKHVADGDVFLAVGVEDTMPEFELLEESGLVPDIESGP